MALDDLESDFEQQVDSDGDSGIGDLGGVKYVSYFSWFARSEQTRVEEGLWFESWADECMIGLPRRR
jgi:hypothetical protein